MSKVLTPARRARLDKLATHLEALPKRYKHFDMGLFLRDPESSEEIARYAEMNGGVQHCGTAACAVGHGPAAGILMPRAMARRFLNIPRWDTSDVWFDYARLFTGEDSAGPAFSWLFGGQWEMVDNHHYGAAARIRYLLANRKLPENFDYPRHKWRKVYAPYRIDAKAQADA